VPRLERPRTLTSVVIEFIRDAVVRGEFTPGTPLPEVRLAQQLETSRGTVREALRALQDVGLVEILPHRGAFVTELTPRRARQIFRLRAVLEAFAVESAISEGHIDETAIHRIEDAFEELKAAARANDVFAVIEADMNFHWVIAACCDQELLLEHLNSIQVQTRRAILYTKIYDSDLEGEVESHTVIIDAIRTLDAQYAAATMRAHIMQAGERLVERMEGGEDR
jgi:DNA-binding GntR family transcriptional regulator